MQRLGMREEQSLEYVFVVSPSHPLFYPNTPSTGSLALLCRLFLFYFPIPLVIL